MLSDKVEVIAATHFSTLLNLKQVYDLGSLAALLGTSPQRLGYFLYKVPIEKQYKHFAIKKRGGGTRPIHTPTKNLKILQKNAHKQLLQLRNFKSCVNGFVPGRDIKRNAQFHVGQKYVLNIDLQDFFGSINYGRIFGLLKKPPYSLGSKVAAALAKACTLHNSLPQGAPTSPILSNLVCTKLDSELSRLAAANKCVYTRYADDITFSTSRRKMPLVVSLDDSNPKAVELSAAVTNIINANGFLINDSKLRLYSHLQRQEVTGLIVNQRVNVKRRFIREIRAMLHARRKFWAARRPSDI